MSQYLEGLERTVSKLALGDAADKYHPRTLKRVAQMFLVQKEAIKLFADKNSDYGDSFAEYGPVGVLIRISDKLKRFSNISSNGISLVNTEGLRDTLLDLHNYSSMCIMLIDEGGSIRKED